MESLLYFLAWALLFFVMMRFGCGAHVMGHGHGRRHGETAAGEPPSRQIDPVCGMTVDTADAKSSFHRGRAFFFCSAACREKFEASPQTYAAGAAEKEHVHGRHG